MKLKNGNFNNIIATGCTGVLNANIVYVRKGTIIKRKVGEEGTYLQFLRL